MSARADRPEDPIGEETGILTVGAFWKDVARSQGVRDALVFRDRRITYAELNARSREWPISTSRTQEFKPREMRLAGLGQAHHPTLSERPR
jgi:hypothetical protein